MPTKEVKYIIFRRLTTADFFNINKPSGTESRGGGQSYIDIPITDVTTKNWKDFFKPLAHSTGVSGPSWTFPVNSLGVTPTTQQKLTIGQRREQTYSIRAQKITSRESNRVLAWHPINGFPKPVNPAKREPVDNLVVYIVKTADGEFWAGWFQKTQPFTDVKCAEVLKTMLAKSTSGGFIEVTPNGLYLETTERLRPFSVSKTTEATVVVNEETKSEKSKQPKSSVKSTVVRTPKDEETTLKELFAEDENYDNEPTDENVKKRIHEVRARNTKAAKLIKELYKGKCQISNDEFEFKKKNGEIYAEIHHLIPLSEGGADSPFNLIVVNPLIHKMLHYAEVSEIDLTKIENNQLKILICGKKFTIKWHPKHSELIEKQQTDGK